MTQTQNEKLTARPANVPLERVVDVDMYNPDGIEEGFQEAWKRIQKPGVPNLVWTPYNGGHWIATRGSWIRDVFQHPENFSSEVIFVPKAAGEKQDMVPNRMDPPEHTSYRAVLDQGLGLRRIRAMEDDVRKVAIELIEAVEHKHRCDFGPDFAEHFPIRVFMALADLPVEDAPALTQLARAMTRPVGDTPEEMAVWLDRASKGFRAYISPIIDSRVGKDGTDIMTLTVNSKINGQPIDREKAIGMFALLLLAGLDTVVNFLSVVMNYLGRHPDDVKLLAEDPSHIPRAVEEFFRRFPVVSVGRMVARDIVCDGVQLKQGEMVLLPTALHNLDEAENADPWAFKLDRTRVSHSTFGDGPHRCAGLHLARMEVTVMLQEWLKRIPKFRVAPDANVVQHAGIVAAIEGVILEW